MNFQMIFGRNLIELGENIPLKIDKKSLKIPNCLKYQLKMLTNCFAVDYVHI